MNPLPASEPRVFHRRLVRTLLLVTVVVLAVFVLGWVYDVLLTIFAGTLLGVFLHGLALAIVRRTHWSYRSMVAALVILLVAIVALCIWLVGPALAAQIEQLLEQIPQTVSAVQGFMDHLPLLHRPVQTAPQVAPLVGAATKALKVGVEAVAGVIIAIVIGVYAAFDPGVYERRMLRLVPPPRRERAREVIERTRTTLMRWIIGQSVLMVVVGTITCFGLWIAGVPLPFALGLLAGLLTFIPYLGLLISIVPALLVALAAGPWDVVWVLVVFGTAHGLEGYVLSPLVARRTVEFPPAFTISVQIFFGAVWGVLGFAFATPLAVVATILIEMLYVQDTLHDRGLGFSPAAGPAKP